MWLTLLRTGRLNHNGIRKHNNGAADPENTASSQAIHHDHHEILYVHINIRIEAHHHAAGGGLRGKFSFGEATQQ